MKNVRYLLRFVIALPWYRGEWKFYRPASRRYVISPPLYKYKIMSLFIDIYESNNFHNLIKHLKMYKNVYVSCDPQNSATSFKIVSISNGSLLFSFDRHINSVMYESKKFLSIPLRVLLPHLAEPHILSTFCELGSTKLYIDGLWLT